ncbi:MAG: peptidase, partial [Patescibacteria group bacterium]|nr:peptidase [Patescibacteria group bacterium]
MVSSRWRVALLAAVFLGGASSLWAQSGTNPNAAYVYPGGGRRGTTFDVVVGGQHMGPPDARNGLDYEVVIEGSRIQDVAKVFVSGGGIKAEVVSWYRPMNQGESVRIGIQTMAKIEDVEKKEGRKISTEEAHKLLGITAEHLEEQKKYNKRDSDPRRQPNPQLEEELTVRITIAPDAEIGPRELRVLTATGLSNPRWFYVGQWPEVREQEPNDIEPHPSVNVQLPAVINGQVMPGDGDRFAFEAKKGMKLVAHCAAREVIPYIADGVPGWFQAILHLYDDKGVEVAYADSLGFRHDPVLFYEVPKDGTYVIEVHDSIYRGREDFLYRITIGEIPYITGLFPLGGRAGEACTVELQGWNLPVDSIRINPSFDRGRSIYPVVVEKDNIFSNRVGFVVDTLPEIVEREPNDTPETAQGVGNSVVINGRIERPGDVDYFRIEGSGAVLVEVYARRLYSPLDSVVRLINPAGKVVAHNDDYEDRG